MAEWINPWRTELQDLLLRVPVCRRPALRRSLRQDYLFSMDLPSFAEPESCDAFRRLAEMNGWECLQENGWLNLRKISRLLPEGLFSDQPEAEEASLLSLLRRHPCTTDPGQAAIQLVKAREEGSPAWERTCRALHQDLARRLRRKEPCPALICPGRGQ